MKYSKKLASLAVVAVLSIGGLAAVTVAAGHDGPWSDSAWAGEGKHGGKHKHMCRHGHGGKHGRKGPDFLAKKLSIMETEIGIRAEQLDAWRDFTDSLQATMKRPARHGGPGMMTPGDDAEPFSLAERFADRSIERAKSAEKLKEAIATLRTTLTDEQLEKVKEIEARIRARFARHGHGPHGWKAGHHHGPDGKGPHGGKGPDSAPPQAGPEAGPEGGSGDTPDGEGEDL